MGLRWAMKNEKGKKLLRERRGSETQWPAKTGMGEEDTLRLALR